MPQEKYHMVMNIHNFIRKISKLFLRFTKIHRCSENHFFAGTQLVRGSGLFINHDDFQGIELPFYIVKIK